MRDALRLRGVTRRFGPVTALDQVDFALAPGEIHGLLGENGAGKTTLARVAAGILQPDAGEVEIGGQPLGNGGVGGARALGVAMVHQHFSLVPRFTGFENVALFDAAAWTRRGTRRPGYRERVEARAGELGLLVELDAPIGGLGVVARQRVEILKALMGDTRVLLLDEPTAVLAPQEVEGLLAVLRQVARAGAGIVLVAHKLDEVLAAADRVTVLRRGRWVMTRAAAEVSARELAEAMVGVRVGVRGGGGVDGGAVEAARAPELREEAAGVARAPESEAAAGAVVAELRDGTGTAGGTLPLRGVSMQVRRGEILGIAGVGGNGQRTLAAVLAGMRLPDSGEVQLPDEVGWIPQDRTNEGLVNEFTISENVAFAVHARSEFRKGPWLDWAGVEETAAALVRDMDVLADSPATAAAVLSGGNQQKVVTGREFLRSGNLLVAESPTRGLDVKATLAVRARIAELARSGERRPGVVLISADLDEILELSGRIAVMVRGRLIPVPREDHNPAAIGELMLSARREGAP
ncbi:MAG: ATP-binding cassette domain-containing protein [Gemmatimonadota bacterium]|nr:ATP-binding cassette domain-containing protein [Gemmatimonadota bacterium]